LATLPSALVDVSSLDARSPELDWSVFHQSVLDHEITGHVYFDFLEPVTAYLMVRARAKQYVAHIGDDADKFVRRYVEQIEVCAQLTRWPFQAMSWFGELLKRLFAAAQQRETRIAALDGLWLLAYSLDQWDVQRAVQSLFMNGPFPADLDE